MHLSTDLVERSSTLPNLTAVRSWVFYANLWATLIEPYIEHTELVDLILSKGFAEFKNDELVLEHVHTFWLKDIPSETFALAPKVVPVEVFIDIFISILPLVFMNFRFYFSEWQ